MQITLVQAEMEAILVSHFLAKLGIEGNPQVSTEMKATRGETGFQAIIDIGVVTTLTKPAPSRVQTTVATPKPVITTADLKRMHEEEAKAEAEAEAEAQAEEGTTATEAEGTAEETTQAEETAVEEQAQEEQQEEAQTAKAPAPVVAPKPAPQPAAQRPATQVAGAAPGPAGAPPKRLFAGFARPSNNAG